MLWYPFITLVSRREANSLFLDLGRRDVLACTTDKLSITTTNLDPAKPSSGGGPDKAKVLAELEAGYRRTTEYWQTTNPVIKWWSVSVLLLLTLALTMPHTITTSSRTWVGWSLPMAMLVIALAWVVHRKWYNTLVVDAFLVGLVIVEIIILFAWALILWLVTFKG